MKKIILLTLIAFALSATQAAASEKKVNDYDWDDEDNGIFAPAENAAAENKYYIPPSPALRTKSKSSEKVKISKYSHSIKPGDNLPDDVYECVLEHIKGVGDKSAVAIIWQSCLRLHLK